MARPFFFLRLLFANDLARSKAALERTTAQRNRLLLARARNDTREWVMRRRERTHQLIQLGGLVMKSGLVELTDDDRAAIYGAMLELAAKARGEDGAIALALWRRRGRRAFDSEAASRLQSSARPIR